MTASDQDLDLEHYYDYDHEYREGPNDEMKALVYKGVGKIALEEKAMPEIVDATDAIVQGGFIISTIRTWLCPAKSSANMTRCCC